MTRAVNWSDELLGQLQYHWDNLFRPRLDGLTDDEYLWEPAPDAWTIRPRGSTSSAKIAGGSGDFVIDFEFPEPVPAPVTTIAWRLGHIIVGVLAVRTADHFSGPHADYESWVYAGTADEALRQLETAYDGWVAGVRALDDDDLARPCGPAEGPYADAPLAKLILHINREMIHHGAEIALLRDLYLRT